MNYVDYAILGILGLGLIIGLFRGFVKPTFSILSWGAAIALVFFLGDQVATLISGTSLGEIMQSFVMGTLEPLGEYGAENIIKNANGVWVFASNSVAISDAVTTIPTFVLNIISSAFAENVSLAQNITNALSNYIILGISAIGILIATKLVFAIIAVIVNRFINITHPVVNRCMGAVLQLILAAMFIFFILFVINIVMSFVQIESLKTLMNESAIIKFIGQYNPIELIIKAVIKA